MAKTSRNYYHDPDDYDIGPLEEEILLRIGSDEDDSDISISESLEDQLLSFTEEEMKYRKNKDRVTLESLINSEIIINNSARHKVEHFKVGGHNDKMANFVLCETGEIADANNNQVNDHCGEDIAEISVQKDMLQSTNKAENETNINSHGESCVKRKYHDHVSYVSRGEVPTRQNKKGFFCKDIGNDNKEINYISVASAKTDQYRLDNRNFEPDAEEKKMAQLREEVDNILADIDNILNSTSEKERDISLTGRNNSDTMLENISVNDSESSVSAICSEISSQESKQLLETITTGSESTNADSSSENRSDASEVDLQESINSYSTSSIETIHEEVNHTDCHHQDDEFIIDDVYDIWQAFYSDAEQTDTACEQIESICGVGKYHREKEFDYVKSTNSEESYKYGVNEFAYKSNKKSTVVNDSKPRFIFINPAKMQTMLEDVYEVKSPEYEIEFV